MTVYSNIWKLYVIKALRFFLLAMPIAVIFFQENDLSLSQVMTLQGAYSLTIALMEIPSGFVADKFGRKRTLLIGTIFCFFGFLIISESYDFWPFLVGELILGIGSSFISGADSALLYDSLLESNKKSEYTKVEGKTHGIGNFSEAIAGIIGGLLADISLRLPWTAQAAIAGLAIPFAFILVEPKIHQEKSIKWNLASIKQVIEFTLFENKLLKWFIIFSSIIGFATLSVAWFSQPYFKSIELPITFFGVLWAIFNFSTGFSSFNAHLLQSRWTQKKLLLFISLGISIPLILIPFSSWWVGLCLILVIYLVRGVATPTIRQLINEQTPSNIRATILSVRSFFIRLTFAVFAPFLGWVTDQFSISESLLMLGIGVICVSLISIYRLKNLSNH